MPSKDQGLNKSLADQNKSGPMQVQGLDKSIAYPVMDSVLNKTKNSF
jgi:hypothetical protein